MFGDWFRLCPVRHLLCLPGLLLIAAYFALRRFPAPMQAVCENVTRPWHRFAGRLCAVYPGSAAELLIAIAVIAALGFILCFLICLFRRPKRLLRLYRFVITCLAAFLLIYGGFCLLWGVYYDAADWEAEMGIEAPPVSTEQLETVTRYFTDLVNEYSAAVQRDENGVFCEELAPVFDRSVSLYDAVSELYPCLAGDRLRAKPVFFSRCMSYINFTGFFFPFTGEANINTDSPACLVPSTIAHEIAHQRGVAPEDEANFAAVLACLENGDPVYCYSAALLAYIHLGNALYKADRDAWAKNYARLDMGVQADLAENNAYWKQFETPVSTVSDTVYTGFLQSYGQELGLQTYGACVDLLIAYYYEMALEAVR